MKEKTEKKVFSYIEEHGMIAYDDRIVAGVSGGADSLCLLFLLLEYAKRIPFTLVVVHVDHGIRPDAGEDARYVEELCAGEGVPFSLRKADVHRLAREEKCSEEDAGRRVRYKAFHETAQEMGGAKIAVAHNSNDNAETMLFHLFRGSGLKGLCGIAPVRDNIIRPILCLERSEAEAYLQELGIAWRTDSTNSGDDYSRNRIRHHILPYAEEEIFSGTVAHMRRTAEVLKETEDYLAIQTQEALAHCLVRVPEAAVPPGQQEQGRSFRNEPGNRDIWDREEPCSSALDVEAFRGLHPALRKRVLHILIKQLSPTGKDIHQVHIQNVLSLFLQEGNRSIALPFGITARRQYGMVVLERGVHIRIWQGESVEVRLPEVDSEDFSVYDLENMGKLEFTAFFKEKFMEVPKNRYTKWFDYDKIEEPLALRSRCTGDYLTIADDSGNAVHKSLKNYMVTEKIPRHLRDEVPLLVLGNHVLWLIGWRISEHFKVDGKTKRILQVKLSREKNKGCGSSETEEKNVRTH